MLYRLDQLICRCAVPEVRKQILLCEAGIDCDATMEMAETPTDVLRTRVGDVETIVCAADRYKTSQGAAHERDLNPPVVEGGSRAPLSPHTGRRPGVLGNSQDDVPDALLTSCMPKYCGVTGRLTRMPFVTKQ